VIEAGVDMGGMSEALRLLISIPAAMFPSGIVLLISLMK
jgi:hypothetical protein